MKYLKKFIAFTAIAVPMGLPFMHDGFRELGETGWKILIGIMLIRPLADILPDFKFLRKLVPLRKEFGILSAVLILSHSYGYFLDKNLSVISELTNPSFWTYANHLMWGLFGSIFALFLLITSNMISIRILKKWWKPLQRTSYLFFVFGALHIALFNTSKVYDMIIAVSVVLGLWLLAHLKVKIRWKRPEPLNSNK